MHGPLIFDLDGTLVDSLAGLTGSLNHALALSGLPGHPPAAVRGFIGNGSRVLVRRAAPADSPAALLDRIEHDFKADYATRWPDGTAPYAGIPEMLATLQAAGFPLAVLSNKPHPFTLAIVDQMFPSIRFDAVLGQRDGIPHKPDPAGALEIARVLGQPPEACMLIGDSTMDHETAIRAGMRPVAVSWGYQDRELLTLAGATSFADDVAGLTRLLVQGGPPALKPGSAHPADR